MSLRIQLNATPGLRTGTEEINMALTSTQALDGGYIPLNSARIAGIEERLRCAFDKALKEFGCAPCDALEILQQFATDEAQFQKDLVDPDPCDECDRDRCDRNVCSSCAAEWRDHDGWACPNGCDDEEG